MLKNKKFSKKNNFLRKNLKGIWEKNSATTFWFFPEKNHKETLRISQSEKKTTIWIKPTKTICEIQYLWHLQQQQQQYKKYISEITQCNTVLWSVPDARRMRRFVQVFGCKQLKTKFKNQIRIGYHQQQHQTPPAATTPNTSTELVRWGYNGSGSRSYKVDTINKEDITTSHHHHRHNRHKCGHF